MIDINTILSYLSRIAAFDPVLYNHRFILAVGAGIFFLILLLWRAGRLVHSGAQNRSLMLRTAALAMICAILLNPYYIRTSPSPDSYYVGVLVDASLSMLNEDVGKNISRFDLVKKAVDLEAKGNLLDRIRNAYTTETHQFADDISPFAGGELLTQAGNTALGRALQHLLQNRKNRSQLGGVLLISDGISIQGPDPIEVARNYRDAGIPVTVIGVGRNLAAGDVSVAFTRSQLTVVRNQPYRLEALVKNTFPASSEVKLELFHNDRPVEERTLVLAPGAEQKVEFEVVSERSQFQTYRIRARSSLHDVNPSTDIDYAAVEVKGPDTYKILLLGGRPDWQNRFIKLAVKGYDQFYLQRIIQIQSGKIFIDSTDPEFIPPEQPSFPQKSDEIMDFDAIVLDTTVLPLLPPEMHIALNQFVADRGGGLLWHGPEQPITDARLNRLSPVSDLVLKTDERRRLFIELAPNPVFIDLTGGALFNTPRPFLPKGMPVYIPTHKSRAARVAGHSLEEQAPILTVATYGGGRTVYLGSLHSWRWRMESELGLRQHDEFWRALLSWLSTGSKPRLKAHPQSKNFPLEDPVDISLRVLGGDYLPRSDAGVKAVLTAKDGSSRQYSLNPLLREPGLYSGNAKLHKPGEYMVVYDVQFPEGESLQHTVFFTATTTGEESRDTRFREPVLRDLARLTGGRYYSHDALHYLDEIILSKNIPVTEKRIYWARSLPYILILLAVFSVEWYCRRREGLK